MMPMAYGKIIVAVAMVAASAYLALGGCGSGKEEQAALRQEMREGALQFESYARGFRDGVDAALRRAPIQKDAIIDRARLLDEMRPHGEEQH